MKKLIAFALAIIMLASLCSCGKTVECDFCGNEVKEKKAHVNEVWGETMYICDECYNYIVGNSK